MTGTPVPPDLQEHAPRGGWAPIVVACVVVFFISCWPTFTLPLVLSNDGPQHILQGFVHTHYDDPRLAFDRVFHLNEPLTARGYLDLFRWLEPAVGWRTAHQIILVLAEALWCSAWATLALRLHRKRWPFAMLGCATGVQWAYLIGFMPFFLGLGATAWAMHLVLVRPAPRHYLLLSCALLICCQIHVFPVIVGGSILFALALSRGVRHCVGTALAGLPSLAFNAYTSAASTVEGDTLDWILTFDPVESIGLRFLGGDRATCILFLILALGAFLSGWRSRDAGCRAFALAGAALLVLGAVAPRDIHGWQLVAPRTLPLAFAVVFSSSPLERFGTRTRLLIAALVAVVTLGHLRWTVHLHERVEATTQPILTLTRRLPSQAGHDWGFLVAVGDVAGVEGRDLERYAPEEFNPWLHLAQVVAVDLGGRPLFTQMGDASIHAILAPVTPHFIDGFPGSSWSVAWPQLDQGRRRDALSGMLSAHRRSTKYLVFVGVPGDENILRESGFEITAQVGNGELIALTAIAHWCAVTVLVPPDASLVETGNRASSESEQIRVPDVEGVVEFERTGCGPRWFRVDGTPCGGSGSEPYGRARADVVDGAVLVCSPDR